MAIDKGNDKWEYTLTVTWNGENITSGNLIQSNNSGDHVYRFCLEFGNNDNVKRNRFYTVSGKYQYGNIEIKTML